MTETAKQAKLPVESRVSQLERLQRLIHEIAVYEDENDNARSCIRSRNEVIKDLKKEAHILAEDLESSYVVTAEELHGEINDE